MDQAEFYHQLVKRYRDNTATPEELEVFFHLVKEGILMEYVDAYMNETAEIIMHEEAEVPQRTMIMKTTWLKYAAAIIILIGVGAYLYISQQKEKPSVTQKNPVPVQNDIAPGGNRATLILADGSKIILDSAANGKIAQQDNATITKNGDLIQYSSPVSRLTTDDSRLTYNTMATPRGGQYQLTLPDGSQVWLNAESSITYPTAFTGKERRVTITGEAYFEVAKDKTKKFIVAVTSPVSRFPSAEIEVLGTQFNINAYSEEPSINTTLIEGSIRLTSPVSRLPTEDSLPSPVSRLPNKQTVHTLTLKPGQQGQLIANKLSLAAHPDIEQAVAWKNGYFNFEGADLKKVMRQIERWYDVQVIYETDPGQREFGGEIQRNLNLSDLLEGLQKTDIHFRIQGKQLIITR